MTVIKIVHFILQRHLKKTRTDVLHDKDAMKVQSYFNVLSNHPVLNMQSCSYISNEKK